LAFAERRSEVTPGYREIGDSPAEPGDRRTVMYAIPERLTNREIEVLRLIADGKSTKQVAAVLGIAFKTAACHRSNLMQKFGVHESVSLVRSAIRSGIVES
jgi:DNA-binding NarL/FixJ family response regulator